LLAWWGCRWSPHGPDEEIVRGWSRSRSQPNPSPSRRGSRDGYAADLMTWHATEPRCTGARRRRPDPDRLDGKTRANRFLYIRHPVDDRLTVPDLQDDLDAAASPSTAAAT